MYYPTRKQISSLNNLLIFLASVHICWFRIELKGDTILIKADPPKGEIDIRIIEINEDGGYDDDGFRELLQEFD